VFAYREAFAIELKRHPAALAFDGLHAKKPLVPQMKQQFKFLFDFDFAFDLIDFGEKLSPLSFNEVVGIHGAVTHPRKRCNLAKTEFIGDFVGVFFSQCRVNGHLARLRSDARVTDSKSNYFNCFLTIQPTEFSRNSRQSQ
jgi:hypothetical protein